MAGGLTTHVLDTARGRPAAGMGLELARIGPGGERAVLARARTNESGRTDAPLIAEGRLEVGTFEIVFAVGEYFAAEGGPTPPFLGEVPVRFGVADARAHYHVPLLTSGWSYTTYRGS